MPNINFDSIEQVDLDSPFYITEAPLGNKIYVIDNYLEQSLHHFLNQQITNMPTWSKTNSVRGQSKTGLPHHQFWGSSSVSYTHLTLPTSDLV